MSKLVVFILARAKTPSVRKGWFTFLPVVFLLINAVVHAETLGVFGKTYPIIEMDMEEYLKDKASKLDTEAIRKDLAKKTEEKLRKGPGLNLPVANADNVFYVDLSIELTDDIKDNTGKILIPKGTKVNPGDIKVIRMKKTYLFIDGRQKKHVGLASEYIKKTFGNAVIILTDGDIFELSHILNGYKFIYHANRHLVERFAIQHTPSVVTQAGRLIMVEEKALSN